MLRENQLNSELDTTRQGYETQIRNQDSSIQQLRESASHYDDRERMLKEQVAATYPRTSRRLYHAVVHKLFVL